MIKDGFTINECDKCVYSKTIGNACINICLYIDDMLILGTNNIEVIKYTKLFTNRKLHQLMVQI